VQHAGFLLAGAQAGLPRALAVLAQWHMPLALARGNAHELTTPFPPLVLVLARASVHEPTTHSLGACNGFLLALASEGSHKTLHCSDVESCFCVLVTSVDRESYGKERCDQVKGFLLPFRRYMAMQGSMDFHN